MKSLYPAGLPDKLGHVSPESPAAQSILDKSLHIAQLGSAVKAVALDEHGIHGIIPAHKTQGIRKLNFVPYPRRSVFQIIPDLIGNHVSSHDGQIAGSGVCLGLFHQILDGNGLFLRFLIGLFIENAAVKALVPEILAGIYDSVSADIAERHRLHHNLITPGLIKTINHFLKIVRSHIALKLIDQHIWENNGKGLPSYQRLGFDMA